MKNEMDECEVEGVPVSPLLSREQKNPYGSVPGLDDEELLSPEELERMVTLEEWGPVLALPVRRRKFSIRPTVDEDGHVEWGAFGSVDFERTMPEFDKLRYKVERLKEQLRDVIIDIEMVRERLPMARLRVLKLINAGVIQLEHIQNQDMLALAKLQRRMVLLVTEIDELKKASWERRKRKAAQWLES